MKKIVGITGLAVFLIIIGIAAYYVGSYSHCTDTTALDSTENVSVTATEFGYFFDGNGSDTAIVFYPGGKVDEKAYAPLLKQIAESGIDCFLLSVPFHLAIFDVDAADRVLSAYSYEHWYLGGHSLGGATACMYAAENADKIDGLILLAAYSTVDLSQTTLSVLSIYGDCDGVLNREKLNEGWSLLPSDYTETVIEGGNHARFGVYGTQKGDNDASVSAEEQQNITCEAIIRFIEQ